MIDFYWVAQYKSMLGIIKTSYNLEVIGGFDLMILQKLKITEI